MRKVILNITDAIWLLYFLYTRQTCLHLVSDLPVNDIPFVSMASLTPPLLYLSRTNVLNVNLPWYC